MRRSARQPDDLQGTGGGSAAAGPQVVVEVCRCGCTPGADGAARHPDWALAVAWAYLTRPVTPADGAGPAEPAALLVDEQADGAVRYEDAEVRADEPDPAALPWWDARSRPARRRAVLPLVLLGELQAGVLLRAVYEVVRSGGTPSA